MAEIFPQSMKKSSLNPQEIMSKLFSFRDAAHKFHLNTLSHAQHKALNKLYQGIQDLQDDILEQLIGYSNIRPDPKIMTPTVFSPDAPDALCSELIKFAGELIRYASENNYHNIENLAQELSGLAAHTRYFLYQTEYKSQLR